MFIVYYTSKQIQTFDAIWPPCWIYAYKEWSYMTDCHLIVFIENENLGIDTKIGFLSGIVQKLLDIWYFCNYANLCW